MPDSGHVDQNFGRNVRAYREAAQVSQEELARRMTERGYGFSQATVWKIEQNKRDVRIGEAVALADALDLSPWLTLTTEPRQFALEMNIDRASRRVHELYAELKAAAHAYLEAQLHLAVSVREATDAGHAVSEFRRTYLDTPAEQAAVEARIEAEHADQDRERIDDTIIKVVDALQAQGYAAMIDPDDIRISR